MKKLFITSIILSSCLFADKITPEIEIAIQKSIALENKKAPIKVSDKLTFLKVFYDKSSKTQTIYYELKEDLTKYSDELKEIYLEELKDKAQDENCSDKRIVDFYGKWEDFKLAYNYKNESFDKTVTIDFKDCKK